MTGACEECWRTAPRRPIWLWKLLNLEALKVISLERAGLANAEVRELCEACCHWQIHTLYKRLSQQSSLQVWEQLPGWSRNFSASPPVYPTDNCVPHTHQVLRYWEAPHTHFMLLSHCSFWNHYLVPPRNVCVVWIAQTRCYPAWNKSSWVTTPERTWHRIPQSQSRCQLLWVLFSLFAPEWSFPRANSDLGHLQCFMGFLHMHLSLENIAILKIQYFLIIWLVAISSTRFCQI